ncbi:hypothetical protein GOBAR_AA07169 [Gossypium barbadense]|uniref:MHD domain-containing protein n=2 Tax=Gossypium TaxID=3633 RepID=A0A2P5YCZ0_GOSBA|nr:hypothetical protein GOBAR_AA07169 [Gossypium barbadense]
MSCLALSLQPANGSDILLQTRECAATESIGDDPLSASSGQLIVGVESKYRVVYRLVNSIYVLGITTADHDNSINVFECINIVNQAVSVIVTACRGVDVTPEKLARKYAEVYMALDIVLRGVSNIRLAAMLSYMHGDGIAKMVHSALDTEAKIRGAETWPAVELLSTEHQSNIEAFSNASFELPPETLAAGDQKVSTIVPQSTIEQDEKMIKAEESEAEKDPFAASEAINKQEDLVGGFKKTKDPSATDLTLALAGLEVTTLPPAEATQSTDITVEGFEGKYGGIEFGSEQATLGEAFEGFTDAWGGGLDASEFLENKKSTEMKGPEMYILEEISAEFRESLLARVGLMGVVYLRTMPPKVCGDKDTEFSFRVEGTSSVKRFVIQSSQISSLGNGMFHVRTAPSEEPIPILKYSLLPRLTPLPLRVRLIKRLSGTLLSVMIQYVSNPELLAPLTDVTFVLKLPVDPTLLKVSPKAVLNRSERELKWHVPEVPLKGTPGKLRVRMPLDSADIDEELEVVGYVKFSVQGATSLSGVCLKPATEEHLLSKLLFLVVDLTIDFYWRLVNLIVVSICTLDSLMEHIIFLRNCNHMDDNLIFGIQLYYYLLKEVSQELQWNKYRFLLFFCVVIFVSLNPENAILKLSGHLKLQIAACSYKCNYLS